MDGNNKKVTSETFGKYTESSGFDIGNGHKADGLKNVSPSMWAPISGGNNTAPGNTFRTPQSESLSFGQDYSAPISQGRPAETKKTAPKKKNTGKKPSDTKGRKAADGGKKANGTKSKSRTPKGKPVSQNKGGNAKKTANAATVKNSLSQKKQQVRVDLHNHGLKKDSKHYEKQRGHGVNNAEIIKNRTEAKKRRRLIKHILSGFVLLLFALSLLLIFVYVKGAPIGNIVVEGESVYKTEKIIDAAGIETGLNMYALSEKKINEKVTADLPYVHSVDFRRKLPDTVILTVTPTTEKYIIVNNKSFICVDEYERILSLKKNKLKNGSFKIVGFEYQEVEAGAQYVPSENNAEKYALVQKIVSAVEDNGVIKKATVDVSDLSNVTINCNGKFMIYLGKCDKLERQIKLASDVVKDASEKGQSGYIDTRYNDMAFFNEGVMKAD